MTTPPLPFVWDGEAMVPPNRYWAKRCDEHFTVDARYTLVEHQERSMASHRQYFAAVRDAFQSWPEQEEFQPHDSEHLRKWALIRTGWCDEERLVLDTRDDALRTAAFMRRGDPFVIVSVSDNCIKRFTARSQSTRAMNKKDFQASKTAVLDLLEAKIGAAKGSLIENAGQAA